MEKERLFNILLSIRPVGTTFINPDIQPEPLDISRLPQKPAVWAHVRRGRFGWNILVNKLI
jgi:hypothetical protein